MTGDACDLIDPAGRTCIVALGARTPLGLSLPDSAAAARAGISRFEEHPYMVDRSRKPMVVARAPYLEPELGPVERLAALAGPAAREALDAPGAAGAIRSGVPVLVGLPGPRPGRPVDLAPRLAERLATELAAMGFSVSALEMIERGHAAGIIALEKGARLILDGRADLCLVGGVDSYIEDDTLVGLDAEEWLHSAANPWGFVPGEAAGFCLLASDRAAELAGLDVKGRLLAAAMAQEPHPIGADAVCLGEGLTEAFRRVFTVLDPSASRVDQVVCDLNGQRYRSNEYGLTVARTAERFADASDFVAPADCWGDVGAASGPLLIGLALGSRDPRFGAGARILVWTSSVGSERTAAILQRSERGGR